MIVILMPRLQSRDANVMEPGQSRVSSLQMEDIKIAINVLVATTRAEEPSIPP